MSNPNKTIPHRSIYGAQESNGLENGAAYHASVDHNSPPVNWATKGLKVTRLRLLSDPGINFWDVSYCHGELEGKTVRVGLPFSQLPKRGYKQAIVEFARKDGVFAKELGILDNISTLM